MDVIREDEIMTSQTRLGFIAEAATGGEEDFSAVIRRMELQAS
jgi:hypothetical protein